MTFEQSEKPGLKRKFAHEFKELAWIFLNLALFRCALATYSRLLLYKFYASHLLPLVLVRSV